jgi:hypothetical protein
VLSGVLVGGFLYYRIPDIDLHKLGGIHEDDPFEFWREYVFSLAWHWIWVYYIYNLQFAASRRAQQELEQKNLWLFVFLVALLEIIVDTNVDDTFVRVLRWFYCNEGQSCHTRCKRQLSGFWDFGSSWKANAQMEARLTLAKSVQ